MLSHDTIPSDNKVLVRSPDAVNVTGTSLSETCTEDPASSLTHELADINAARISINGLDVFILISGL